jgi:hypothetical protein
MTTGRLGLKTIDRHKTNAHPTATASASLPRFDQSITHVGQPVGGTLPRL